MCGARWMASPEKARARWQPENCARPGIPEMTLLRGPFHDGTNRRFLGGGACP